jgi:hypothetical protein
VTSTIGGIQVSGCGAHLYIVSLILTLLAEPNKQMSCDHVNLKDEDLCLLCDLTCVDTRQPRLGEVPPGGTLTRAVRHTIYDVWP